MNMAHLLLLTYSPSNGARVTKNYNHMLNKQDVLAMRLSDEQRARVMAVYDAYEKFSANNPEYPVPFSDCNTEEEVKADLKYRIKQHNQNLASRKKRQAKLAEEKAQMERIMAQVRLALSAGKTAEQIIQAIQN